MVKTVRIVREARRTMLMPTASPIAVVLGLLNAGWLREAVLVRLERWVMVCSGCGLALMGSGSRKGMVRESASSRSFTEQASSGSGESWIELPVVMPVAMVSTDWVGEPCCESGEMEMDEWVRAEGGTTTSWD